MFIGTFSPVSNRATWTDSVQVINDDDGAAFDISNATEIELQVRDPADGCARLTAKLSDGSIVRAASVGVFTFTFTAAQMGALCAKTYDVGCVVTAGGEIIQIIIGTVPVLEGIVR